MTEGRPVDYRLANAEMRHAESPETFFLPSADERSSLRVGDLAKVIFEVVDPTEDLPSAERMWVEVTTVADGRYVGTLANEPRAITTIGVGDTVEFGPEHVISLAES